MNQSEKSDSILFQEESKESEAPLPVMTPLTKFDEIQRVMAKKQPEMRKDQYFVRNLTAEFITHYHAYSGVIFEVMTDSNYLSSVTLFKA